MGARRSIPGYQECGLPGSSRSAGGDLRSNARSSDDSRDEGLCAWGRLIDYGSRPIARTRERISSDQGGMGRRLARWRDRDATPPPRHVRKLGVEATVSSPRLEDFDVDLAERRVVHKPSGIEIK